MKYSLGISIMAVPERQERVEKLLAALEVNMSHVTWDTHHAGHIFNWWQAAALAWQNSATHALILEDDAEPCQDFLTAVEKIIAIYPNRIISFFTANPMLQLQANRLTLVPHNGFSDVAVVYPVPWLRSLHKDFILHKKELLKSQRQASYGADEMRMKLQPAQKMWVTHPSLVQHGGAGHSTLGHRFARSIARPCVSTQNSALALDWAHL